MSISAFGATHIGGATNRENQDTFFVSDHMVGVFDGHGRGGRAMATTACSVFQEDLSADFVSTFARAEEAVRKLVPPYVGTGAGGTTASALYVDPTTGDCLVAHVGDSEARYFDSNDGDGLSLTADHSPCSMEEFLRIHEDPDPAKFELSALPSRGLRARPVFVKRDDEWIMNPAGGNMYSTVRCDWGAYVVSPYGDNLAMTRSLGDFHMKGHGVIATPTVTTVAGPPPGVTRAIVMASDGLWDGMKWAEVRDVVRAPEVLGNAEAATKALMAAGAAANAKIFGTSADNITAVVVYVTMPDPLCLTPPTDISMATSADISLTTPEKDCGDAFA